MASQEASEQRLLSASENCPWNEEPSGESALNLDPGVRDRAYWLHSLERLATPVLKGACRAALATGYAAGEQR